MSFLADLKAAAIQLERLRPSNYKPNNPKPPGVIRPGSTSDLVLKYLESVPGFRSKAQITSGINRGRQAAGLPPISVKATDWALLFLRAQKRVEAVEDSRRNRRYLRYRAAKGEGHD